MVPDGDVIYKQDLVNINISKLLFNIDLGPQPFVKLMPRQFAALRLEKMPGNYALAFGTSV